MTIVTGRVENGMNVQRIVDDREEDAIGKTLG
jgi:hypothetical protein